MTDLINHKDLAESRLATQFKESVNFINYVRTLLLESDTLEDVFQDLLNERWIDTAIGAQLDVLGVIVGQPRILVDATAFTFFGFLGAPGAQTFGSVNDPEVGGRFRSVNEPATGNRELLDPEYRAFIRARVVKNSTNSTVQDVIDSIKLIIDNVDTVTIVEGDMSLTIDFGRTLTANEEIFVLTTDLIPKTAGVTFTYINT